MKSIFLWQDDDEEEDDQEDEEDEEEDDDACAGDDNGVGNGADLTRHTSTTSWHSLSSTDFRRSLWSLMLPASSWNRITPLVARAPLHDYISYLFWCGPCPLFSPFFVHAACAPTFNFLQHFFLPTAFGHNAVECWSPRPRETEGCTIQCGFANIWRRIKTKQKITLGVKDPLFFSYLFERPSPHTSS